MIEIQVKGLNKMLKHYHRAPARAQYWLGRAMQAGVATLAKNTRKDDPVPWRTGYLLHSFRHVVKPQEARWFPIAPYAIYVDQGTRPHIIKARRAKVLADKRTKKVFGKVVHHPGIRPRRFMRKIAIKSAKEIQRHFNTAVSKFLRELS